MAASYRLLRPQYLSSGWRPAGDVINEGVDVHLGWAPTLAVDPLNTQAVNAFYAAGPRDNAHESLNFWAGGEFVPKPATYWYIFTDTSGQEYWALSGLGASLAMLPLPFVPLPYGSLLLEGGGFQYLLLESGFKLKLER